MNIWHNVFNSWLHSLISFVLTKLVINQINSHCWKNSDNLKSGNLYFFLSSFDAWIKWGLLSTLEIFLLFSNSTINISLTNQHVKSYDKFVCITLINFYFIFEISSECMHLLMKAVAHLRLWFFSFLQSIPLCKLVLIPASHLFLKSFFIDHHWLSYVLLTFIHSLKLPPFW